MSSLLSFTYRSCSWSFSFCLGFWIHREEEWESTGGKGKALSISPPWPQFLLENMGCVIGATQRL